MEKPLTAVERHYALMPDTERHIRTHPGIGYHEEMTGAHPAAQFENPGYPLRYADGIPGFPTAIDTGKETESMLAMTEMDAVLCPSHPDAGPRDRCSPRLWTSCAVCRTDRHRRAS